MKLLRQFGFILIICYVGEIMKKVFSLALPGSIIGMIILFILLYTKLVKLDSLKEISDFLMDHLAFFFIPAGVGLLAYMGVLKKSWPVILGISLITTILVAATTGLTIEFMKRRVK